MKKKSSSNDPIIKLAEKNRLASIKRQGVATEDHDVKPRKFNDVNEINTNKFFNEMRKREF